MLRPLQFLLFWHDKSKVKEKLKLSYNSSKFINVKKWKPIHFNQFNSITYVKQLFTKSILISLAVRLVLWRSWRRSVVTLRFGKPSLIWVVCRPWCPSWTLLTKSWSAWLQRPSPMWPSLDGPAGWSDNMVASRDWWEKFNLVLCVFVKTGWLWLKSCIRKGDKRIKCMLKVHT